MKLFSFKFGIIGSMATGKMPDEARKRGRQLKNWPWLKT
tara:strand:- start:343 stop:459 length:117 start_codon:yes stop_codon:yes gene_type:complete